MESIEYLLRTYPIDTAIKKTEMTDFDNKMLKAIEKMKESYNAHKNRKSIIVLKPEDIHQMQSMKDVKKDTKKETKKVDVIYCKAIKMDGNNCTAKAKPNCDFCGRHIPKK